MIVGICEVRSVQFKSGLGKYKVPSQVGKLGGGYVMYHSSVTSSS